MSTSRSRRPAARLVVTALLLAACRADAPTGDAGAKVPVTVSADLAGSGVTDVTVIVTGPGIRTPIVANLATGTGTVPVISISLDIPVGGQRTFTVHGYDAGGEMTHEGATTATVRPSGNAAVPVRLRARTGDVPVGVGIGEYRIELTPTAPAPIHVGQFMQFSMAVFDAAGDPVFTDRDHVYAVLDPSIATIHWTGVLHAVSPGTSTVYLSYRGAVATAPITVIPAPPSPVTP